MHLFPLIKEMLKTFAGLNIGLIILGALPSSAQVIYGSGPNLQAVPSVGEFSNYQLDANTFSPTPSFSLGAFGGYGNDWANANTANIDSNFVPYPYANSSTGIGNYGVSASLRVPFGHGLSEFCRDYAKAKAEFEKTRAENNRRNSALSLVQQCDWMRRFSIDPMSPAFDEEEFSSLKPCRKFIGARNVGGQSKEAMAIPDNFQAPVTLTVPFSPEPQTIIEQRRQLRRF